MMMIFTISAMKMLVITARITFMTMGRMGIIMPKMTMVVILMTADIETSDTGLHTC